MKNLRGGSGIWFAEIDFPTEAMEGIEETEMEMHFPNAGVLEFDMIHQVQSSLVCATENPNLQGQFLVGESARQQQHFFFAEMDFRSEALEGIEETEMEMDFPSAGVQEFGLRESLSATQQKMKKKLERRRNSGDLRL